MTMPSTLPDRRLRQGLSVGAGLLAVLALALSAAGAGGPVRLLVVVAFALLGPGTAVAGYLDLAEPALRATVTVAVGLSILLLTAMAMLVLHAWHPLPVLSVLQGATLLVAVHQLVRFHAASATAT